MPVIDNPYLVDEKDVAYAPSDIDLNKGRMTRSQVNDLIDSLCDTRMENPDVVLMDQIKDNSKFYNPIAQEKYEIEQDRISIEDDILKGIFESDTPMSIEERNEYIANGTYQKYQDMLSRRTGKNEYQRTKEDIDTMNDIEAEIRARANTPIGGMVEATEVISEEEVVDTSSFPNEGTDVITKTDVVDETEVSYKSEEDTRLDAESVIEEFEHEREEAKDEKHLSKSSVRKLLSFPNAIAGLTDPYVNNDESLSDVVDQLKETVEDITSPDTVVNAIEKNVDDSEDDDYVPMTMEEFNDVPATEITVPESVLTSALMEQYDTVTYSDAMKLISVMNRYKAKEKFNVFEALPDSIKTVISKEAASVGADRATINFFAKTFINDLVNNTYLDREINDFNDQLQEALAPMGNIVGTMMDEYTDEVYDKFTTQLRTKADEINESDPEKATQLIVIAKNFEEAVSLKRLTDYVAETPGSINKTYKNARDNWKRIIENYNNAIGSVSPKPRDLTNCLNGLINAGYPEDYAKAIVVYASSSIMEAIEKNTLEEHIYAYYLSNSLFNLNFTTNNCKAIQNVKKGIDCLIDMIDKVMLPLKMRNTKKNKRRNRRNKK